MRRFVGLLIALVLGLPALARADALDTLKAFVRDVDVTTGFAQAAAFDTRERNAERHERQDRADDQAHRPHHPHT